MKLRNLFEQEEKKLGDLKINGKVVAPRKKARDTWEGDLLVRA